METVAHYPEFTGENCNTYVITPENVEFVNLAIQLGKPIVVEGEPGCGKTSLAAGIAEDLGIDFFRKVAVKSTSSANDLLYRFDALHRLQDSQTRQPEKRKLAEHSFNYVTLEALGEAIFEGKKSVILLDEIDKADIDFPDDLLDVIDNFSFRIDEIPSEESKIARDAGRYGSHVAGPENGFRPIMIFTSNRKNPLSNPFLRRCMYLELNFPEDPVLLKEIVANNLAEKHSSGRFKGLESISTGLIEAAVDTFLQIRSNATDQAAAKKPATAELIDWIHVLHLKDAQQSEVSGNQPRYWELLFKTMEDRNKYRQVTSDES